MFGNEMKNGSFLHPWFLPLKSFRLRSNIKHSTVFHHHMKHLEVRQKYSAAHFIFNSLLWVFHLVMKHCVLCLIYYVMIFSAVIYTIYYNIMGDKLLLNFGAKFQRLYYCIRNFCNLIGLEQRYFRLIWNTYMWKLQTFRG